MGIKIIKIKYRGDISSDSVLKGVSTGFIPSQVKIIMLLNSSQKINFFSGVYWTPCQEFRLMAGKVYKIRMAITKAITPPNLLGTLRKMA